MVALLSATFTNASAKDNKECKKAKTECSKADKKSKKNKKSSRGGRNVTIRQGDTLSEIAKRNGTTVKKLKKLNKISGSSIRAGKKIRIK